jgi:Spy/CpxP family protein refolding chaperone
MNTHKLTYTLSMLLISLLLSAIPAQADERSCSVDWHKLSLSANQNQQIHSLEQDWNTKYMQLQPQIVDLQHKLVKLLADPKSDPVEIMTCQQSLSRLKEQLRNLATANYLRKRAILTNNQQHQLEFMLQQAIAEKQRSQIPNLPNEEQSGIGGIMHKVRWAIQQH